MPICIYIQAFYKYIYKKKKGESSSSEILLENNNS